MEANEKELTGYPSIDKPWEKYYNSPESFKVPMCKNYDYIYQEAKKYGDNIAIEYFNAKITYNQLFDNVEKVAKSLKALNVQENEIVSVCLPNIPEVVYVYFAINRIGAVANMLDLRCNSSTLIQSCVEGKSKLLITLDMVLEKFLEEKGQTQLETIVTVSPTNSLGGIFKLSSELKNKFKNSDDYVISWKEFINVGIEYKGIIDSEYKPDATAVIAYTGGTTGIPKGVSGTNENLNSYLEMTKYNEYPINVSDRSLLIAPPWTYYGLNSCLNVYFCKGQVVVMLPKVGADELGEIVLKHKPNQIVTVPSALNAMINDIKPSFCLDFIKSIIVGADKLDETFETTFNDFLKQHDSHAAISKGYGMTEVMAAASYTIPQCNIIGSVGIPCVGNIISIFEEGSEPPKELKIGEKGEVAIFGPSVMKGYFGEAAKEDSSVLRKHSDGTIWAHTGDIGHMDCNGVLYIDGRIKRMFTKNGYKVFAGEVERQIMKHEKVENCAVIAVPDDINGSNEKAYVVLKKKSDKDTVKQELFDMLKASLYDYEIPDYIGFIAEMPLTRMNKIDYRALEKMAEKI